jgi:hypothetical protein
LSDSIETVWQERLTDLINTHFNEKLDIIFSRSALLFVKGGDISSLVNEMCSQSSDRDFFVDFSPAAELIYGMMISYQDQETIPVIAINTSLAWLNVRLSYRIKRSIDPETLEKGMDQIKSLVARVEELGGNLAFEGRIYL